MWLSQVEKLNHSIREADPLFEKNAENPFRVRLDSSFFSGTIGLTSELAGDRRKIMEFPVDWRYSRDHRNYGRPSPELFWLLVWFDSAPRSSAFNFFPSAIGAKDAQWWKESKGSGFDRKSFACWFNLSTWLSHICHAIYSTHTCEQFYLLYLKSFKYIRSESYCLIRPFAIVYEQHFYDINEHFTNIWMAFVSEKVHTWFK